MTGEFHPGWVNGIDATAARLATGLLAAPDGSATATPLRSLAGIRPTPGFPGQVAVVAGSNPVAVSVNPFQAVIPDLTPGGGGAFLATLGSAQQLPLAAADGQQSRLDRVVAEIDPSSANGFVVHVVTGQPANPPQPPAVKNPSYLELAQIQVPPTGGGTPTVTDRRTLTTALGGVLPVFKPEQRPAAPYQGMYVHRLDTNNLELFDGAAWRTAVNPTDTGWVPLTLRTGWYFPSTVFDLQPPQVRRIGDTTHLRGMVWTQNAVAPKLTDLLPIGDMPTSCQPPHARIWQAPAGTGTIQVAVTNNVLHIQASQPYGLAAGDWVGVETSWINT
ncbi:hypothetical protein [Kutzneria sp. CA-103260]|uniref:hypothetical protein n=1 Tax=Kutzneria sp. CA-103260 TaxID=2802641 RepID=UPI001BA5E3D3|nr:hypothetical protein [Kutzneria sp. CA-103260]QUQ62687.1 hypothetical protein JJ691_03990 [Kutzneria sp. CA-103260]